MQGIHDNLQFEHFLDLLLIHSAYLQLLLSIRNRLIHSILQSSHFRIPLLCLGHILDHLILLQIESHSIQSMILYFDQFNR